MSLIFSIGDPFYFFLFFIFRMLLQTKSLVLKKSKEPLLETEKSAAMIIFQSILNMMTTQEVIKKIHIMFKKVFQKMYDTLPYLKGLVSLKPFELQKCIIHF